MDDTEFIRAVRSALNNLHEPDQLRANPLISLLGFEGRVDAPAALAETITDAIEGLRADADEGNAAGNSGGASARAWLSHDVLFYRYVRGYSREEAARKLYLSDRQFSREVRSALEVLATVLWRMVASASGAADGSVLSFQNTMRGETAIEESDSGENPSEESNGARWLHDLPVESPAGWREVLESVLTLMQPLLEQHQSFLEIRLDAPVANLLVAQNTLRQTLLLLLGWLVPVASHTSIRLAPASVGGDLLLRWQIDHPVAALAAEISPLEIPRQLLDHRGGSLTVERAAEGDAASLSVLLTIPALAQVPVLAIDDNLDTIQLFQRYVQGTRYALVGVSSPDEVPRALERVQPRIILLDVMMPQVDGWDMLARLRQLPDVPQRAIIVCSIMPLESVARSLGASGFLQKPVLPQALLQTLDRYAA